MTARLSTRLEGPSGTKLDGILYGWVTQFVYYYEVTQICMFRRTELFILFGW